MERNETCNLSGIELFLCILLSCATVVQNEELYMYVNSIFPQFPGIKKRILLLYRTETNYKLPTTRRDLCSL